MEARLESFLREIVRWGERTNLVGSLERSALEQHVSDALAAAPHLPSGARVVDLGSGAGLPGIPLAIARADIELILVEIRERRVHFLRHVVRTLGLACGVERVDLDASPPAAPYDVALLRALAPPAEAVPRARPWVHDDGEIWLWSREAAGALPWPVAGEIPIAEGRGSVLRIRARDVPRRTP